MAESLRASFPRWPRKLALSNSSFKYAKLLTSLLLNPFPLRFFDLILLSFHSLTKKLLSTYYIPAICPISFTYFFTTSLFSTLSLPITLLSPQLYSFLSLHMYLYTYVCIYIHIKSYPSKSTSVH